MLELLSQHKRPRHSVSLPVLCACKLRSLNKLCPPYWVVAAHHARFTPPWQVVKQCVATEGVEPDYVRAEILPEFFRSFWVRRMALDRRNYRQLVETTVELANKARAPCLPAENSLFWLYDTENGLPCSVCAAFACGEGVPCCLEACGTRPELPLGKVLEGETRNKVHHSHCLMWLLRGGCCRWGARTSWGASWRT